MFEGYEGIIIFVASFIVASLIYLFFAYRDAIKELHEYKKMLFYLKKMNIEKDFKSVTAKLFWVHDKLNVYIRSKNTVDSIVLDIITLEEIYRWIVDVVSKMYKEKEEPKIDIELLKYLQTQREDWLKKRLDELAKKEEERLEANKNAKYERSKT